MEYLKTLAAFTGLVLALSSMAVAQMQPQQQQSQNQSQMESFQVTGECVMMRSNQTNSSSPFMMCQYTRSSSDTQTGSQSPMDQMMQRMNEMMGRNQSIQGQGMGGQ